MTDIVKESFELQAHVPTYERPFRALQRVITECECEFIGTPRENRSADALGILHRIFGANELMREMLSKDK